jgi:hypothetical protein
VVTGLALYGAVVFKFLFLSSWANTLDDEAQIIDLEEEEERNAANRSDWRPYD